MERKQHYKYLKGIFTRLINLPSTDAEEDKTLAQILQMIIRLEGQNTPEEVQPVQQVQTPQMPVQEEPQPEESNPQLNQAMASELERAKRMEAIKQNFRSVGGKI